MKTLRWAIATSLVGALFAGTAMAQVTMSSPVQQPSSIQQMGFQSDDSAGYAVADPTPAPAEAAVTPPSPSNQPPALPAVKAGEKPALEAFRQECETPTEEGPYKLFHGPWLDCQQLDIRGYFDVGYTSNPAWPLNNFNGPVGYNDRANEFDLNQFYMIAERVAKVDNDCGVDYGYRVDLMYGTDRRFVQTVPGSQWDSGWNNGNRFYGLAMPQMYGDLAYDKLLLRGGHFYEPGRYEDAQPTENFFYSHTYSFLYGDPTTLTGGYAIYEVRDKLSVNAGFDTGWNEFSSLNGKPNVFFGVNWTSQDDRINVTEEVFLGDQSATPGVDSTRYLFNTVVKVNLGCRWRYVLEQKFGHDSNTLSTATPGIGILPVPGMGPASWTGFSNYLFYDINDCWGLGLRYEYFEDLDGALVTQVGPPSVAEAGSKWNDVTIGLNWKPNKNVTVRSEVRWDWAANSAPAGAKPFDDGNSNSQFLWGNDVVIRF
jgi:hypothetical protein